MTIIPTNRLLFWAAMVFFPFAGLATAFPSTLMVFAIVFLLLCAMVLMDAFLTSKQMAQIDVSLPETVKVSKGRQADIELSFHNAGLKLKKLKVGLPFPAQLYSKEREMVIDLPGEEENSTFQWPFIALKQGSHSIHKCYVGIDSLLGFWLKRKIIPVSSEIRAYPNILPERNSLSALFMNKQLGIHSQRQLGKGRDFEQLREYMPGDSFEDIHWKATAKRCHPVTKVYQIERTQEIYLIVDASRLSGRYTRNAHAKYYKDKKIPEQTASDLARETVLERYITASLLTGMAAEKQGDLFGMLTFTDRIQGFIKAKNGKAHYNACRDMLFTLAPERVTPDFSELFTFIGTKIRKRALLIFLTNLDDPVLSESFIRHMHLITKRHIVLVNMLNIEKLKPVFSSSDVASVDDIYKKLGKHFIWERLRATETLLQRHGAKFHLLDNEKMCMHIVGQYLDIKQRQLL